MDQNKFTSDQNENFDLQDLLWSDLSYATTSRKRPLYRLDVLGGRLREVQLYMPHLSLPIFASFLCIIFCVISARTFGTGMFALKTELFREVNGRFLRNEDGDLHFFNAYI